MGEEWEGIFLSPAPEVRLKAAHGVSPGTPAPAQAPDGHCCGSQTRAPERAAVRRSNSPCSNDPETTFENRSKCRRSSTQHHLSRKVKEPTSVFASGAPVVLLRALVPWWLNCFF